MPHRAGVSKAQSVDSVLPASFIESLSSHRLGSFSTTGAALSAGLPFKRLKTLSASMMMAGICTDRRMVAGKRDGHVWLVADTGSVTAAGTLAATNVDGSGGTVEMRANTIDVSKASVQAGLWKLGAPSFSIDTPTSAALTSSLSNGTSVDVEALTGNLAVASNMQWTGKTSLTLGAARNVSVASNVTVKNTGSGNLTLRADALGADNGGSVSNMGTIDWSKSTGTAAALFDMSGSYAPGKIVSNPGWSAASYSGLVTQVTG